MNLLPSKPCDNALLLYGSDFNEFFYGFWEGITLSRLLPRELSMVKKIEAMFPLLTSPQQSYLPALRTWARNGFYTPEEQDILLGLVEIRVNLLQPHLDALPRVQTPDLLTRTTMYFCISMSRLPFMDGRFYPLRELLEDHFRHGVFMINFCMSDRCAINFNLFGVHLLLEEADFDPARLHRDFHSPMALVACQLTSNTVWDRVEASRANFWKRLYFDYFLHMNVRYDLCLEEQCCLRYFYIQHHGLGRLLMWQMAELYFRKRRHQGSRH